MAYLPLSYASVGFYAARLVPTTAATQYVFDTTNQLSQGLHFQVGDQWITSDVGGLYLVSSDAYMNSGSIGPGVLNVVNYEIGATRMPIWYNTAHTDVAALDGAFRLALYAADGPCSFGAGVYQSSGGDLDCGCEMTVFRLGDVAVSS